MLDFEEVYKIVESKLSERRFYHSKCVMERAIEYAKIYGIDEEKAKLAGISHDIAKEVPKEDVFEMCMKYDVELDDIEKKTHSLIHAKLGAQIAKIDFGFDDEICNAIKFHTTGKAQMSMLEKIVFLADCTGEDRTYDDAKYIYKLALEDLDKALLYYFRNIILEHVEEEKVIHVDAVNAYNYLIK